MSARIRPVTSIRPFRRILIALSIAALAVLAGCSSMPRLTHVWQSPDFTGPRFKNIVVVGVSERASSRRIFENVFSARFRDHDVQATPSHELFPGQEKLDRDTFVQTVREQGFDGVVVARVVGIDRKTSYSPGYVTVAPAYRYPGDFWGYYGHATRVYESPGQFSTWDVVSIETSLYTLDGPLLVWSGQTETVDPSDIEKESDGLAEVIMRELEIRGLIKPGE
jgi:hypothetical protein